MTISRRRLLQTATVAAAGVGLGIGHTAAPAAADAVTLTAWGFTGGGVTESFQSQVQAFQAKHPDVTVNVQTFGYQDIHTNLLNAIVAGTGAPDLCCIDALRLGQYTDGLVDMADHRADFEKLFVPPTLDLGSYQGKLFALSGDSEPVGLFYRKDLWDKYGVSEDAIKTWADLAAAAEKLNTDSNGEVHLYGMIANDHYLYEVMAVQQGFPGYYFDDTDSKVIVDDPKAIEAAKTIKMLWDAKGTLQNPGGDDIYGNELTVLLKSGKVTAQLVGAGWFPSSLTQQMPELAGSWRLMRVPAIAADGPRTGYQYPTLVVIPTQSPQPDLAREFSVLALTGDGAKAQYDKYKILPAYAPLLDELKPQADPFFGGQKIYELWDAIARDSPKVFFGKGFTEAQQILGSHMSDILSGAKSPEDGMKDAAAEMRQKLNKG